MAAGGKNRLTKKLIFNRHNLLLTHLVRLVCFLKILFHERSLFFVVASEPFRFKKELLFSCLVARCVCVSLFSLPGWY
jgi:hypothetical protein